MNKIFEHKTGAKLKIEQLFLSLFSRTLKRENKNLETKRMMRKNKESKKDGTKSKQKSLRNEKEQMRMRKKKTKR